MILTLAVTIGFQDTTLIGNAYGNLLIFWNKLCVRAYVYVCSIGLYYFGDNLDFILNECIESLKLCNLINSSNQSNAKTDA